MSLTVFPDSPRRIPGTAGAASCCASTCVWLGLTTRVVAAGTVGLLAAIPLLWDQRVALLIAVTVIAGVSSHTPAPVITPAAGMR